MKRLLLAIVVCAVAAAHNVRPSAQGTEDLARRQYESGLAFVQNGRFAEALKDFQAVVGSFPQSSVADDALLQMSLYQLEVAQDHAAAQAAADRLLKDYAASDSAPMAYVVSGRLMIAKSRAAADVEAALASFERVPRLFPNSPAVAAASYYTGESLRLSGRTHDALQHFRRVSLEYPQSVWAARAVLSAAANLAASDRAVDALGGLQRIRQQFPGSPEAATALNLNTIIYRLFLRKPAPYRFSGRFIGERDKFRDVVGVKVDEMGRVLIGHKQGVTIFDAKGTPVRNVAAIEPMSFFLDGRDRVVVARREMLVPEGAPPFAINVPVAGRPLRQVEEMPAAISLSSGDRLIADRKEKTVLRISSVGKYIGNFAAVNAERMARNEFDDVAMIDRETNSVALFNRDGKALGRIPAKGTNYQIEDPADVAFDSLGHLYVLDGRRAAVLVFGSKNRLLATFTSTVKEAGALQRPRAMALDAAGRLYVYDESSQRIQVYQ
jgi:TolA-binding protein